MVQSSKFNIILDLSAKDSWQVSWTAKNKYKISPKVQKCGRDQLEPVIKVKAGPIQLNEHISRYPFPL